MGSSPMAWIVQSTIKLWIVGGFYRRYINKIDSNTILLLSSIPCHWIGTMGRCQKSPLEGKQKRKSTGSTREAMVDDNEREEEEEGDTAPACYPKRAGSQSQI